MKVSVILAYPHPGSFNHAIADTVAGTLRKSGHRVAFHDLYGKNSTPCCRTTRSPVTRISRR